MYTAILRSLPYVCEENPHSFNKYTYSVNAVALCTYSSRFGTYECVAECVWVRLRHAWRQKGSVPEVIKNRVSLCRLLTRSAMTLYLSRDNQLQTRGMLLRCCHCGYMIRCSYGVACSTFLLISTLRALHVYYFTNNECSANRRQYHYSIITPQCPSACLSVDLKSCAVIDIRNIGLRC
jgi:hypothetical protein